MSKKNDYNNIFLKGETAKKLYKTVENAPIYDYHCHLSPKEIFEDKVFNNIGEMWLAGDHYKWRLMRAFGVDEVYITGSADWFEKFEKYANVISLAAGNPLYHWSHMELRTFFGIDTNLSLTTAKEIWEKANAVIKENQLSPRKLIAMSRVEYIATTDDVIDTLEFHSLIKKDESFKTVVAPSFRTDNLLLIRRNNYKDYINKLSMIDKIEIKDIAGFKEAIIKRLDYFCLIGCKFSDVGIEIFPNSVGSKEEANEVFLKALNGEQISDVQFNSFLGYMYCFLGGEYKKRNMVMQWHLAVKRNANSKMFSELGADCGGDCTGDIIKSETLARMLDAINQNSGLPKTIIYTLNPSMYYSMATVAGSFRNVIMGAAWWFCDHKRGIEEQIRINAEIGHLATFLGMLTDSRSFLSYTRHDYFRRILCSIIGGFIDDGEFFGDEEAQKIVEAISFLNIKNIIGE